MFLMPMPSSTNIATIDRTQREVKEMPGHAIKGKHKPSGELAKPDRIECIQVNLQKAKLAQLEISRRITQFNKNGSPFIIFAQEPMVTNKSAVKGVAAYQLGNTSSRTITEVKQR